jgi:hypothetical protein
MTHLSWADAAQDSAASTIPHAMVVDFMTCAPNSYTVEVKLGCSWARALLPR